MMRWLLHGVNTTEAAIAAVPGSLPAPHVVHDAAVAVATVQVLVPTYSPYKVFSHGDGAPINM